VITAMVAVVVESASVVRSMPYLTNYPDTDV
jgi:hypothetical protein